MNHMKKALSDLGNRCLGCMRSPNGFMAIALVSIILAIISSLLQNPLMRLPVDSQFGILDQIPWEYWLALALSFSLMMANVLNGKRYYALVSMLFFAIIFVNIESFFQHDPVGTTDAYMHFMNGATLGDASNAFFTFELGDYPNGYFGSFIFTKVMVETLGIGNNGIVPLLSIFRFLVPIWFFGCMYLLFTKITSATKARIITIVMILAIPYLQFHYSPHAFGLIIMPIMLYTIIVPAENPRKNMLLQMLLFTYLMFTHGPTTIYIALVYAFATVMHHALRKTKKDRSGLNVGLPVAIYFLASMMVCNPLINQLVSNTLSEVRLLSLIPNAIGVNGGGAPLFIPDLAGLPGLERLGGNFLFAEVIRLYVLTVFLAISVYGTCRMLKTKDFSGLNILTIGSFFVTGLFGVGSILYPSLNMTDRSFLYLGMGSTLMMIYLLPDDFLERLRGLKLPERKVVLSILAILLMLSHR
jgi:hypothetical protein